MRWQTTAALAVILIALGAFYYVYEIRLGPEREKTEGRKGRVFTVEPADVAEVELKRADSTVKLKRADDGWQILEPVNARGDRGAVDETVTSIVTARMDREIEAEPKALGDFGLDRPAAEATLKLKDGKQIGLVLGAKSPTGVWVYAREAGKPAVFVVGDSVLRDTTRPVAEFRDKTVLAFEQKDVTGLELDMRDEKIGLEQADGRWKVTKPRPLPADADTVRDFLDKLRAARVKEFAADAPKSLEPFGLDKPVRLDVQTGRDEDLADRARRPGQEGRLRHAAGRVVGAADPRRDVDGGAEEPRGPARQERRRIRSGQGDEDRDREPQGHGHDCQGRRPLEDHRAAGAGRRSGRSRRGALQAARPPGPGIPDRRRLGDPALSGQAHGAGEHHRARRVGAADCAAGALDRETRRLAQRLRGGGGPGAGGAGRRQGPRGPGPIVRRPARPHAPVRARAARHQAHPRARRRPDRPGRAQR